MKNEGRLRGLPSIRDARTLTLSSRRPFLPAMNCTLANWSQRLIASIPACLGGYQIFLIF